MKEDYTQIGEVKKELHTDRRGEGRTTHRQRRGEGRTTHR